MSLTLCTHTCGKCRKPWSHHLIDQDACGLPKKCLCPACDHVLAEAKGQGALIPPPPPREPWELTQVEYAGHGPARMAGAAWHRYCRACDDHHRQVRWALKDGKPVSARVLADYPDLQGKREDLTLTADVVRPRQLSLLGA